MQLGGPNMASATSSRAESASKHIRVCKVAQDYIGNWMQKSLNDLKANKLQYAVHRDDPFIGCGRPLFGQHNGCFNNKKAYAVGLPHLHEVQEHTLFFLVVLLFFFLC
jgi:hypothetical protein